MKAALFCAARYMGQPPHDIWPLSGEYYPAGAAVRSMQTTFDQFRSADEFGFDWVTVAEHHYSGFSLTPNPDHRWNKRDFESWPPYQEGRRASVDAPYSVSNLGPLTNGLPRR